MDELTESDQIIEGKMAAPKRSKFQRERDLEEISSLYLRGWSQQRIAGKLGVTRQQVAYDLKKIQGRWLESGLRDFDAARAEELAKLDEVERRAWEAWERSVGIKQETQTERKTGENAFERAALKKYDEAGDPRYLQVVLTCVDKRCKLLGLDAPQRLEHSGRDGGPISVTGADLSKLSTEELRQLAIINARLHGDDSSNSSTG